MLQENHSFRLASAWTIAIYCACIVGCGDSGPPGSPNANPETINGFLVPIEPDASTNASTLAGVDGNANGIRDDAERRIASQTTSQVDFAAALEYAKSYQALITSPTPATRTAAMSAYSAVACKVQTASLGVKNIDLNSLLATTVQRQVALDAFFDALIGFSAEELLPCA